MKTVWSTVRAAGALAVLVLCWPLGAPAADTRPNILFILVDDQRWDSMGYYGNDIVKTPNLDKLAAGGARLDAFYVAGPLCCPSRAALLSGLYPHQTGILVNRKHGWDVMRHWERTPSIAEYLNRAGYVTGFVGKAHLDGDPRKWGFKDCPVWFPGGESRHQNPRLMVKGVPQQVSGAITPIFADAAVQFLQRHQKDRWFLWFATTAPHVPFVHDPKHPYDAAAIKPPPGWPPNQPLSDADWAGYYSTVSMLDEQIGRVLDTLDRLKLTERTLVFMTSDNGYMFGSHGYKRKRMWFEESVRMPALARYPGTIKPGTIVRAPLVSVDFLPTLLELAGVQKPEPIEGVSMLPALTGGTPRRTAAYAEALDRRHIKGGYWQMARDGHWKYVRLAAGDELLYDLEHDPFELTDLGQSGEHAAERQRMRQLLQQWLDKTP